VAAIILDRDVEKAIRAERAALGIDRHDEVWDGVYVMSPLGDLEPEQLVGELSAILHVVIAWAGLGTVQPGANVSDQDDDWTKNYRVPDVVVVLNETTAVARGPYWLGGPDFAIEVMSENDQTRDKLPFYAKVGTHELLIVDREPWALELHRLDHGAMKSVGRSTIERFATLTSEVVPLDFRLVAGDERPRIELTRQDGTERWVV
jgi:hypothetical protein